MTLWLARVSDTLSILVNSDTALSSLNPPVTHQSPLVLKTLQVCAFDLFPPA